MLWKDFLLILGILIVAYYIAVGAYILLMKKQQAKLDAKKPKQKSTTPNKHTTKDFINKKSINSNDIVFADLNNTAFQNDDFSFDNMNVDQETGIINFADNTNVHQEVTNVELSNNINVMQNGALQMVGNPNGVLPIVDTKTGDVAYNEKPNNNTPSIFDNNPNNDKVMDGFISQLSAIDNANKYNATQVNNNTGMPAQQNSNEGTNSIPESILNGAVASQAQASNKTLPEVQFDLNTKLSKPESSPQNKVDSLLHLITKKTI
jgi:hypothetical protein